MLSMPVVRTASDGFRWPHDYASSPAIRPHKSSVWRRLSSLSLTTAFSGICCPSTAAHMAVAGFAPDVGSKMDLHYHNSIEWSNECNAELYSLPTPPVCRHQDIAAFLTTETKDLLKSFGPEPTLKELEYAILRRPGALNLVAPCLNHRDESGQPKLCPYIRSLIHVAGPPCTDFSKNGSEQKLLGKTTIHLLCWIALLRDLMIPIILAENVEAWHWQYVASWLPMYDCDSTVLRNVTHGFPVERTRRFTIFVLKDSYELSRPLGGPLGIEASLSRQMDSSHSYLDYMIAKPAELDMELLWASTRDGCSSLSPLSTSDQHAFERSLVPYERKHLSGHRRDAPGVAYTMSQNPDRRACHSKRRILHTLTAGQHLIFVDPLNRWASARELLSFQGFPVYNEWLTALCADQPYPCCSFNFSRLSMGLTPRDRRHMTVQAGNSMHTGVVGAALVWILAFCHERAAPVPRALQQHGASAASTESASSSGSIGPTRDSTMLVPYVESGASTVSASKRCREIHNDSLSFSCLFNSMSSSKKRRVCSSNPPMAALPIDNGSDGSLGPPIRLTDGSDGNASCLVSLSSIGSCSPSGSSNSSARVGFDSLFKRMSGSRRSADTPVSSSFAKRQRLS